MSISYRNSSTQTYYLPSFIGAIRTIKVIKPEMFILDLTKEDFIPAKSFLRKLLEIRDSHPSYNPKIFLGQAATAILQEAADTTLIPNGCSVGGQEIGIVVAAFELKSLIGQLEIAIRKL